MEYGNNSGWHERYFSDSDYVECGECEEMVKEDDSFEVDEVIVCIHCISDEDLQDINDVRADAGLPSIRKVGV